MKDAARLASLLRRPERTLPPEDAERLRPHLVGVKDPDLNPDGSLQVWDPREKGVTKHIHAPKVVPTDNWDIARAEARSLHGTLVIVGAGSSILKHDLSALDRIPSMGINWTLKYFQPTYLHILDKQPFRKQLVEVPHPRTIRSQAITCSSTLAWAKSLGYDNPALSYEVKDDSCGKYPAYKLAERGSDMFQSFPNSLGYALQAGVALGYRRMILLGFDFAGFHFFGDGRSESCFSNYGAEGEAKRYLQPMLMAQALWLQRNGIQVRQVGPTEMPDMYDKVPSLEAALA